MSKLYKKLKKEQKKFEKRQMKQAKLMMKLERNRALSSLYDNDYLMPQMQGLDFSSRYERDNDLREFLNTVKDKYIVRVGNTFTSSVINPIEEPIESKLIISEIGDADILRAASVNNILYIDIDPSTVSNKRVSRLKREFNELFMNITRRGYYSSQSYDSSSGFNYPKDFKSYNDYDNYCSRHECKCTTNQKDKEIEMLTSKVDMLSRKLDTFINQKQNNKGVDNDEK